MLRALGGLRAPEARASLERTYRDRRETYDVRMAAAEGLVLMDDAARGGYRRHEMWRDYRRRGEFALRPVATFGTTPAVVVDRGGLSSGLDGRGPRGVDVTNTWRMGDSNVLLLVGFNPLVERETGEDAGLLRLALGGGRTKKFYFRRHGAYGRLFLNWSQGVSLAFLDLETAGRDTFGAGVFGRAGVAAVLTRRLGLELYGELHAWAGYDGRDTEPAGAGCLGFSLTYSY
jgi:hypothetical protein